MAPLSEQLGLTDATEPEPVSEPPAEPPPVAIPTRRSISPAELRTLAEEIGLGARLEDLAGVASTSYRLSPQGTEGAGFAGGVPTLPAGMAWPQRDGDPLRFVAYVELAHAAAARLAASGVWIFQAIDADAGASVAVFDHHPPADPPAGAALLSSSSELVLPRAWSAQVAEMELSGTEQDAWQRLRSDLADRQGVPSEDAFPRPPVHRLLGFPEDRRGDMPLRCELLRQGIDPGDRPPRSHPRAAALEAPAADWQMLLQLDEDERLGWRWGGKGNRLHLWVRGLGTERVEPASLTTVVQ